jgi:hypothetical protein
MRLAPKRAPSHQPGPPGTGLAAQTDLEHDRAVLSLLGAADASGLKLSPMWQAGRLFNGATGQKVLASHSCWQSNMRQFYFRKP